MWEEKKGMRDGTESIRDSEHEHEEGKLGSYPRFARWERRGPLTSFAKRMKGGSRGNDTSNQG